MLLFFLYWNSLLQKNNWIHHDFCSNLRCLYCLIPTLIREFVLVWFLAACLPVICFILFEFKYKFMLNRNACYGFHATFVFILKAILSGYFGYRSTFQCTPLNSGFFYIIYLVVYQCSRLQFYYYLLIRQLLKIFLVKSK